MYGFFRIFRSVIRSFFYWVFGLIGLLVDCKIGLELSVGFFNIFRGLVRSIFFWDFGFLGLLVDW